MSQVNYAETPETHIGESRERQAKRAKELHQQAVSGGSPLLAVHTLAGSQRPEGEPGKLEEEPSLQKPATSAVVQRA